ncbi:tetratricopeptide repeat protein [Psychromonas hadalis]|uniref:tetratricopeptide repeat protein n=1 Tax=Psychromonas hadalis TaxID=211669 RepID=UPI0003B384A8|nr:hypothetical protein [Psychromonas hadalis]
MSIINKMHQDLQADESPILASMPTKKRHQKRLLFILISLLLASSIGLSYLIYNKEGDIESITEITQADVFMVSSNDPISAVKRVAVAIKPSVIPVVTLPAPVVIAATITPTSIPTVVPTPVHKVIVMKENVSVKAEPVAPEKKSGHLEIKKSVLSNLQRAELHLKRASIARKNNDLTLVAREKSRALAIKPDLHETRKSLALYYYGIGEQRQATNLLKKGALTYPDYSDFNLMLSRIALRNGDQQKAYLYLNQYPPKVKGNLDYHVSYAILAQKFEKYAQSERLYQGLLLVRPSNGRWRMSLAIAQDKQGKKGFAVESYQKALLQIDLSSKAKKYINLRLTYLANQ